MHPSGEVDDMLLSKVPQDRDDDLGSLDLSPLWFIVSSIAIGEQKTRSRGAIWIVNLNVVVRAQRVGWRKLRRPRVRRRSVVLTSYNHHIRVSGQSKALCKLGKRFRDGVAGDGGGEAQQLLYTSKGTATSVLVLIGLLLAFGSFNSKRRISRRERERQEVVVGGQFGLFTRARRDSRDYQEAAIIRLEEWAYRNFKNFIDTSSNPTNIFVASSAAHADVPAAQRGKGDLVEGFNLPQDFQLIQEVHRTMSVWMLGDGWPRLCGGRITNFADAQIFGDSRRVLRKRETIAPTPCYVLWVCDNSMLWYAWSTIYLSQNIQYKVIHGLLGFAHEPLNSFSTRYSKTYGPTPKTPVSISELQNASISTSDNCVPYGKHVKSSTYRARAMRLADRTCRERQSTFVHYRASVRDQDWSSTLTFVDDRLFLPRPKARSVELNGELRSVGDNTKPLRRWKCSLTMCVPPQHILAFTGAESTIIRFPTRRGGEADYGELPAPWSNVSLRN
ncbi:hypothetical protein SCHPADRAFT_887786 [Schizopora paradoxa]|uniref:Uncharacterized protein n=1 Tax=Schizopora paradoxa TaxID=27342 RepID=A0A0H2RWQ8_9AGAM|nr:hypothetical protein SCHPADRAFT_887786 [Schizopora paradoxa]